MNKTSDIKKYRKEYRINNPEKWYKKNVCKICKGEYQNNSLTNHLRTKKHNFVILKTAIENLKKNKKKITIDL